MLEELRKELTSQSARLQSNNQRGCDAAVAEEARTAIQAQTTNLQPSNSTVLSVVPHEHPSDPMDMLEPALLDASPGSSPHDLSGWGAFDSMVRFLFLFCMRPRSAEVESVGSKDILKFRSYQVLEASTFSAESHSLFEKKYYMCAKPNRTWEIACYYLQLC